MAFQDRTEAARLLAGKLSAYRGKRPLVLGIPRGGVLMARIIAEELGGELDIVLARKLRAPGHPEFAIGAVTENGSAILANSPFMQEIPHAYVEVEKEEALATLRRQRDLFTPTRPPISAMERIVIVVDDGIATGATITAALSALRHSAPTRLLVAAAVAPARTVEALKDRADEVICLAQPEEFDAVSTFFEDFSEVSDDDVVSALRAEGTRRAG